MCSSPIVPEMNCTMVTPTLSCINYSYNIRNVNGTLIKNDSLTVYSGNIFSLVFNQSVGHYVVTLCDGTTREVNVGTEDDGMLGTIILLPIILGVIFLVIGFSLSENHNLLKLLFYFLSIAGFFGSVNIALYALARFYNWTELILFMSNTVYWVGAVVFFLIAYFVVYLIIAAVSLAKEKKQERIEF